MSSTSCAAGVLAFNVAAGHNPQCAQTCATSHLVRVILPATFHSTQCPYKILTFPLTSCQVRFDLHHTFQNPQRIVESQPFEVTEHGWGEFDIMIHVSLCGAEVCFTGRKRAQGGVLAFAIRRGQGRRAQLMECWETLTVPLCIAAVLWLLAYGYVCAVRGRQSAPSASSHLAKAAGHEHQASCSMASAHQTASTLPSRTLEPILSLSSSFEAQFSKGYAFSWHEALELAFLATMALFHSAAMVH